MSKIMRRFSRSSSSSSQSQHSTDATSINSNSASSPKVKSNTLDFGSGTAAPNSRRLVSPGPASPPQSPARSGRRGRSRSAEPEADDDDDEPEEKSKRRNSKSNGSADTHAAENGNGGLYAAAVGAAGAVTAAVWGSKEEEEEKKPKSNGVADGNHSDDAPEGDSDAEDTPPSKPSKKIQKRESVGSHKSKQSGKSNKSSGSRKGAGAVNGRKGGESDDDQMYESPDEEASLSPESRHMASGSDDEEASDDDEADGTDQVGVGSGKNRPKINSTKPRRKKLGKQLNKLTYDDVKLDDAELRRDIYEIWDALHLFMNSRMIEAEDICLSAADHRLYFSVGYTLIQCIKSLMTFEPEDLEAAISCCRDSLMITQHLRKKDAGLLSNAGKLVTGTVSAGTIGKMTVVQRHAELVFAECLLLKAILGIIYSGDFVAFLKEALNMRTAYATYRSLSKFLDQVDEKAGGEDNSIDQDFRSGVYLGNGLISLVLSLLPSKVLKIMEVFGFTGDREWALRTLQKAGKWSNDPKKREPAMDPKNEGIRRQICDMALLFHHLVISTYLPVTGVDISMADKILHYNIDRYPEGVFFLYFAGRLYSTQTMGEKAVRQFHRAIGAQREYIQLQHICHWDLSLTHMAMAEWDKAHQCFIILDKESNWSKAIYAYALGCTAYEKGDGAERVSKTMRMVPDLMQRIAGKSIPLEKFVARKAKKFVQQGNRLLCPGIELAYFLNSLGMAPRWALFENHLDSVSSALAELHKVKDTSTYGSGTEYWDDYCLAHLLRGLILRFIAYPEEHTRAEPKKSQIPQKEAAEQAEMSFRNVFKHGPKVQQDHQVVWFAHYELGRLYAAKGEKSKAFEQYNLVLDHPKDMEYIKKTKGKVSLQNMCLLRTNAAYNALKEESN